MTRPHVYPDEKNQTELLQGWEPVGLPRPGTMVEFARLNDQRVLSGCFVNGGFNDIASGDFYTPRSVRCWRSLYAATG
jgi:hypothetical protein